MTLPKANLGYRRQGAIAFFLIPLVGLGLVIITGALYGYYSQRWGTPADLDAAGEHLADFPQKIGEWQLLHNASLEKSVLDMLECTGYVNRHYIHRDTGREIAVAIIVGPPGPVAVHTPEICFSSRAYELQSERKLETITSSSGREHSFWSVDFESKTALADKLRVHYAWSLGRLWKASGSPRFQYGAAPLLYKIQVAAEMPADSDSTDLDSGYLFLHSLVDFEWKLITAQSDAGKAPRQQHGYRFKSPIAQTTLR